MVEDIFSSSIKRVTENSMTLMDLIGAAETLRSAGQKDQVIQLYKQWLDLNHQSPFAYAVYFNYANILSDSGDLQTAKDAFECAIALNPDFAPAHINLGTLLERMGSAGQAIMQWWALVNRLEKVTGKAVDYKATALKQIARVLEMNQHAANAEGVLRDGLELNPNQLDVAQHYVALRMAQCEWPIVSPWENVDRKTLMKGIGPLSMSVYTDDPMLQLGSAWHYNKNFLGYSSIDFQDNHRATKPHSQKMRRRIGYVGSDFREHAVGHIMAEVFELHNRDEFEIFVYYCGPAASDPLHDRFKASAEHWIDINAIDDATAARRVLEDNIEILVDINGYTKFARTKLFAMRPAPVLVNWLGYPATMGSPYHHYIIADDWIIPKTHEIYYSEKVLRLPCYQPNNRQRLVAPTTPTRAELGLPEDATVFCCFNGVHKINHFSFDRWMAILKGVPGSVLWLLKGEEETNKRLLAHAEQQGIAQNRIVFAETIKNPLHLARYPLADMFLDTSPYGAHVTASDSLWMGVPILTVSGRSFASRVCGSLVRAAGLPEIVCSTPEEYIERGIQLGNDRPALQQLKKRLMANRDTCSLFDTSSLIRHLENLYKQMWNAHIGGQTPCPDLDNLDTYLDIACEADYEAVEAIAVKDLHGWYKARLAKRHHYTPIRDDKRLWTRKDILELGDSFTDQNSPILEWPRKLLGLR